MPQAIVDPEELIRFSHDLKEFDTQLKQSMSRLNGQFSRLGETWRDQEHHKFAQEYRQTVKQIERFLQISEQHIPFLLRKAQRAGEYLNQK